MIEPSFWKNKKVFITGHTGFKGGWLSLWLNSLGAKVSGYSLEPPTDHNFFSIIKVEEILIQNTIGDIRNLDTLCNSLSNAQPEIVINLAAQSLVRESYLNPVETYSTNIIGTVNVLEAVRKVSSVKAVLNITSDKCYHNNEWTWGYRENEPMGGHDPYSSSKGCAELISSAYRDSFLQQEGISLATARAGNVIGGGDWAKDRIVPDAIRSFMKSEPLILRNPKAIRPWQHVLEPLSGYIMLCQNLVNSPEDYSGSWNFGPSNTDNRPVSGVADLMAENWKDGAYWEIDKGVNPHESVHLRLDCTKANTFLNWSPLWNLEEAIYETVSWYKSWNNQENMYDITLNQIKDYQSKLLAR